MDTTEHALRQLRDLLARQEITVFLGPDLPEQLTGVPGWSELERRLEERGGFPFAGNWPTAAARYEQAVRRRDLIGWLAEQINGETVGPVYSLLATLPVSRYIAATYDERLQRALTKAGRHHNIIIESDDLNFVKSDRPSVVKLLGEVSPGRLNSLLLTASDIQRLLQHRAEILEQEVYPAMTGQTLLILGQDINSELFRTLYYKGQDNVMKRQSYAVWPGLEDWEKETWKEAGLTVIDADPLEFLKALTNTPLLSNSDGNYHHSSITKKTSPTLPQSVLPRQDKIKVLFLAANPTGTTLLQLGGELRKIKEKIRAAEYRDALEIIPWFAVRADDLLQALLEHKPHIVHFSGHGSETGEILVADDNGHAQPISQAALTHLFKTLHDNIRVVLLNACFSSTQAEAITRTIDCAIGMNKEIGDIAATVFAASFYRAIGFGKSVQDAFELGKTALLIEGITEENTPELLLRDGVNASEITLIQDEPT